MKIQPRRTIQAVRIGLLLTLFSLLFLNTTRPARAQVTTAEVTGTVTDATGAILPGANVVLQSLDTGILQTAQVNSAGEYTFNLLPIGRYSITVTAQSFKTFKIDTVALAAGDRSRLDAKMALGSTTETVEVTSLNASVQTDSSTVGALIDTKAVQELPLNGRNYINLVALTPGVTAGTAPGGNQSLSSGTRPDDRRQSSAYSANGQDPSANNNMIDGVDNNDRLIGTIGVRPSIDAIAEVKVQTNLYSAEVGRTSGGVVNILTKSGTNQFHGSAFEFLRNDLFDANSFYNFLGSAVLPKPKYRQNQFGGSLGGPIFRDKTFFFGDYEGLRVVQGGSSLGVVLPTGLQRVGNFGESCTSFTKAGVPNTFNSAGICSDATRQISLSSATGNAPAGPIPFNRLDQGVYASLLDPIGLKLASLYPLPSTAAVNGGNYNASGNKTYFGHTFDVKIEHHLDANNTLRGRYSFNKVTALIPPLFPAVGGIQPGSGASGIGGSFPGQNNTKAQNLLVNLVHVVNSNLLVELNASYLRDYINSQNVNYGQNTSTQLGISGVNTSDPQTGGLVGVAVQGFQGIGDSAFTPILEIDNSFQYSGAVSYTRGQHNIKVGGGFIRRQFTIEQSTTARGSFTFNGATATVPVPVFNGTVITAANPVDGAGVANLLIGAPATISRSLSPFASSYRTWEPFGYVQDDWRATHWLTLNLGLRYDVFTPKVEVRDRIANLNVFTGQVLYPGLNTNRTTGIKASTTNFAPRIGFAATVARNTVVRGGYGISFYPGDINSGALLKNPPFTPSLSCGPSTGTACSSYGNFGTLSQGLFLPSVNFSTTNLSSGLSTIALPAGSGFVEIDQNFKSSYMHQFNVIAERSFGKNVASVGYVGTVGRNLVMNPQDINRALPSGVASGPGISLPKPISLLNPSLGSVQAFASAGISNYNALQVSVQRRFSRGLSGNAGYTYSHEIDDATGLAGTGTAGYGTLIGSPSTYIQNIQKYDRSTGDFNITHRGFLAATYELPRARVDNAVLSNAINGWQINGTVIWQGGLPFTVTNATSRANILGLTGERPDRIAAAVRVPNPSAGVTGQYIDPNAFAYQAISTLGNSGRNLANGPGASFINTSFFKNFSLPRETSLQFRTEIFNVPNHRIMGQPVATLGSATFGKITSLGAADQPRQIQFALRLSF